MGRAPCRGGAENYETEKTLALGKGPLDWANREIGVPGNAHEAGLMAGRKYRFPRGIETSGGGSESSKGKRIGENGAGFRKAKAGHPTVDNFH